VLKFTNVLEKVERLVKNSVRLARLDYFVIFVLRLYASLRFRKNIIWINIGCAVQINLK
jgi:hypothetical protein